MRLPFLITLTCSESTSGRSVVVSWGCTLYKLHVEGGGRLLDVYFLRKVEFVSWNCTLFQFLEAVFPLQYTLCK